MRFALINPGWEFEGSIYFGCREPHLPLELRYSEVLLNRDGHDTIVIDAHMEGLSDQEVTRRVSEFGADIAVVTTAPTYLFWRCAQPELRVPGHMVNALRGVAEKIIAVGPHASTTPRATMRKLDVDAIALGECEDLLPLIAETPFNEWDSLPSVMTKENDGLAVAPAPHVTSMAELPALTWGRSYTDLHSHHHHRFEAPPAGPGAEMETSRGCPFACSFCAKDNFRNSFRRRPNDVVLEELDGLVSNGVTYIYFIDEIFLAKKDLLKAVMERGIQFGIQTRIDLWRPEMIELLGRAGCVSIEAGVESLTPEGRDRLDKNCRLTTSELTERLLLTREHVPFVQANLIDAGTDSPDEIAEWRHMLQERGVWANEPVPLFPYPGSPDYTKLWGAPDDRAWERAHEHYLAQFDSFSDIQEERPLSLEYLEREQAHAG